MLKKYLIISLLLNLLSLSAVAEERESGKAIDLINALGCRSCHTLAGEGGTLAPELDQIGSRKTAKQILQHLIEHQKPDPNAFMPSYNTTSAEDLKLMSDYLYNLQ